MFDANDKCEGGRSSVVNTLSEDGFTLVEILVVLGIVALLAAVGTPQVLRYLDSSRIEVTKTKIQTISTSLELFRLDNGRYPSEQEGLSILIANISSMPTWRGPYIKGNDALSDGWGSNFLYNLDSSKQTPLIVSFGRDGKSGGEGVDGDISG